VLGRGNDFVDGLAAMPDRNGAVGRIGDDEALGADQTRDPGEETEGSAAVVEVHQNEFQPGVIEDSVARRGTGCEFACAEAPHRVLRRGKSLPLLAKKVAQGGSLGFYRNHPRQRKVSALLQWIDEGRRLERKARAALT